MSPQSWPLPAAALMPPPPLPPPAAVTADFTRFNGSWDVCRPDAEGGTVAAVWRILHPEIVHTAGSSSGEVRDLTWRESVADFNLVLRPGGAEVELRLVFQLCAAERRIDAVEIDPRSGDVFRFVLLPSRAVATPPAPAQDPSEDVAAWHTAAAQCQQERGRLASEELALAERLAAVRGQAADAGTAAPVTTQARVHELAATLAARVAESRRLDSSLLSSSAVSPPRASPLPPAEPSPPPSPPCSALCEPSWPDARELSELPRLPESLGEAAAVTAEVTALRAEVVALRAALRAADIRCRCGSVRATIVRPRAPADCGVSLVGVVVAAAAAAVAAQGSAERLLADVAPLLSALRDKLLSGSRADGLREAVAVLRSCGREA
eukprot:TRINITY_DN2746_c1_g1_i1.p1 TRINITY_DN2746_c1_g1~~TRINITY_DN2746_c1_g1_i1.p1  ORF type:complete len:395 (+),score=127.05 TRINITY_DN2746_c1_g1_i1:47-1186(+)